MKQLANVALYAGLISLIIGIILRVMVRTIALGLAPSSFLEFSVACFLLAIAIVLVLGKEK